VTGTTGVFLEIDSFGCALGGAFSTTPRSCPDNHAGGLLDTSIVFAGIGVPTLIAGTTLYTIGKQRLRALEPARVRDVDRDRQQLEELRLQLESFGVAPIIDRGRTDGALVCVSAKF